MQPTTTSDLIRQVRNQIRETNKNSITDQEILDTLNRGQQRAIEVMTRQWPYNYIVREKVQTDDNGFFDIPEEAKGNRIVSVEVDRKDSSLYTAYSLSLLNYKEVSDYRSQFFSGPQAYPIAYYIQGRKAEVFPKRKCDIYVYYVRNPEKIVKDAGYIFDIVKKTETTERILVGPNAITGSISILPTDTSFKIQGVSAGFAATIAQGINGESGYKYIETQSNVGSTVILRFSSTEATVDSTEVTIPEIPERSLDGGVTYSSVAGETWTLVSSTGIKGEPETKEVIDYLSMAEYGSDDIDPSSSFNKSSYFNIVDAQTGLIKASFQADPTSKLDNDSGLYKLYLRTPLRNKVLNQPIDDPSTLDIEDLSFEVDDYVCSVKGSCVPELDTLIENFIVQYSSAEIKRSMGNQDYVSERDVLKEFEKDVKKAYKNRDKNYRINIKTRTFVKGRYKWTYTGG